MADETFRRRADKPPRAVGTGRFFHADFVTRRAEVGFLRLKFDSVRAGRIGPRDGLLEQIELRVFGDVNDLRIFFIYAVAFRLHVHQVRVKFRGLVKAVFQLADVFVAAELLTQIVARKNERAARVLFLGVAKKICRVADLRLHFLFAIAVIIIRDDGDDDAVFIAAGELERVAAIVDFVFGLPAHSVAALAVGRLVEGREADGFFRRLDKVRRENHAARVAAPVFHVERGIIFRQQRVARVAKNIFDEIQIAHQISGNEEAHLHRFLLGETGNRRANDGPQQQRDETFRRLRLRRGERQLHDFARRRQREREQLGERRFRHAQFVVGNRQAALGDVENSRRRAPVAARIVQHAVRDAVGIQNRGGKFIAVNRQRQHARQTGAIQRERARRQFRHDDGLEIIVEKILDAAVGGAKVLAEQPVFFARRPGHRGGDGDEFRIALHRHRRAADVRELDVDVRDEMRGQIGIDGCNLAVHWKKFSAIPKILADKMPEPRRA